MKTAPYDTAEFLTSPEAMRAYMAEALETNDAAFIAHALGTVARAKSMTDIARKTGLSRESLYRALSAAGRPELATVMKVLGALDLQLSIKNARPAVKAMKVVKVARGAKVGKLSKPRAGTIAKAKVTAIAKQRTAKMPAHPGARQGGSKRRQLAQA
ncbi:putative transcriptional regulator [Rhodopseudomonas palustris BisB18]|uniref:Putative transcriptional regulator n=2 Tax=Rhodopseudomonas palustris TaxID=1076 RepID=Q214U9_RHOPB